MNKTVKKIISGFLGLLFIIIVVCGIVVATYVFSTPDKDGESRQLIMGDWVDDKAHTKLVFSEDGDFTMYDTSDGDKEIAKGFFKVKEDDDAIKILITSHDDSLNLGIKLGFFCTISYSDLKYPTTKEIEQKLKHDNATCKFLFQDSDGKVYKCERIGEKINFYGKEVSGK